MATLHELERCPQAFGKTPRIKFRNIDHASYLALTKVWITRHYDLV